ncbi:hypothetical protein SADUNF_Sadunf01G0142500 [Salix dunnii]|uniref:NPH3 domain-containing protein n=1 Tax=Salix dunnii TaxID=1413687 RepID=A0A835NBI1_9ROSI|nr:hypothetical protein SADUNF_Sadunf01G0142500 [Salix dunnii]
MKAASFPEPVLFSGPRTSQLAAECWFDDACILDMDYFAKTLAGIKAKGARPDFIGSIIAHYASKWLPDLSGDHHDSNKGLTNIEESPESVTALWMKKRFFVETLVGILPPEKDSTPCSFLLRLLRIANMVNAELAYRDELEKRISWQLDQASLKEIMIPSFSHTCGTLLDVELIIRLVRRFANLDEVAKSGADLIKVARLVDSYLAEAAVDSNLNLSEFVALAGALPSQARATDDGLYRAVDTYLKAHPGVSKQERKVLFRLIDSRKLSQEASLHAAQNERLPVRAAIQALFSEQTKLNRQMDWSGSFSGTRSPNLGFDQAPTRLLSKRETSVQQMEIRKLREDVLRLQSHCYAMQMQMERMMEKKKGFFRWKKKLGMMPSLKSSTNVSVPEKIEESIAREGGAGSGTQTPVDLKTKLVRGKNLQNLNSHFPKTHNSNKTYTLFFKPQKPHYSSSILNPPQNSLNTTTTTSINTQNPTNSRLLQLCLSGNIEQAQKHLASIQEIKIPVEEESFVALIRLCENKRGYSEGEYVWSAVLSSLVTLLSVRLGNALLSMFVGFGDVGNAWNVLGRMGERFVFMECFGWWRMLLAGIRHDVYSFPCLLRSCGGATDLVRGGEVHAHVVRFGFEMYVDVVNALITMYMKCADIVSARMLFDKMPTRDRISCNAMILGYFDNMDRLEGLKLFFRMLELSIDPDLMTFDKRDIWLRASRSLIQMYLSVGHWKEAETVFSRMECRDIVAWTTMISGYVDNLLPDEALKTYKTMEIEGTMPD